MAGIVGSTDQNRSQPQQMGSKEGSRKLETEKQRITIDQKSSAEQIQKHSRYIPNTSHIPTHAHYHV